MIKKKKCSPDLKISKLDAMVSSGKTYKTVDEMVYDLTDKKFRTFWRKQRDQITVFQLAQIRKVTPQAIRKAINEGRIKAEKIGKQWVIRRADVS